MPFFLSLEAKVNQHFLKRVVKEYFLYDFEYWFCNILLLFSTVLFSGSYFWLFRGMDNITANLNTLPHTAPLYDRYPIHYI